MIGCQWGERERERERDGKEKEKEKENKKKTIQSNEQQIKKIKK